MNNIITKIKNFIFFYFRIFDEVSRNKAVETCEAELEELEYIFGILVQGSFIGMPAPPVQISLDLLPLMEKDLLLMIDQVNSTNEPIAKLFSTFDIG